MRVNKEQVIKSLQNRLSRSSSNDFENKIYKEAITYLKHSVKFI